jgi:fibronectin type 3 domain-containing protein
VRLALATAVFALFAGCGYVGPPLPPALNIPKPATDLRVTEVGDKIIVHFTPPEKTTEDLPVETLRAITLYVGPGEANFSRERWAATAHQYPIAVTANDYEFNGADWAGQNLVIGLRTTGRTGKQSDWSTSYSYLLVGTPLIAPTDVTTVNAPDAVSLKWSGNAPRYRVMRAVLTDPMPKLEPVAEVDAPEYMDRTIADGARYQYVILGIAGKDQESLPSEPVEFSPKDVFAPEIPMGLSAVAGERSITLSWSRSPDDDLEGYNIFRAVGDGAFTLLAPKVTLPAYTDAAVQVGTRYRYVISAVDKTGNESGQSMEATAQVEAQ